MSLISMLTHLAPHELRHIRNTSCHLLSGTIDHLQEVTIDKQTREYPSCDQDKQRADKSYIILKPLDNHQAILTSQARAEDTPTSAKDKAQSHRAQEEHKDENKQEAIEVQRLIAEQPPTNYRENNGNNQRKDTEALTHQVARHTCATLATDIIEVRGAHRATKLRQGAHIRLPIEEVGYHREEDKGSQKHQHKTRNKAYIIRQRE